MSVKTIRVTKHPLPMPQARLVQGDAETQQLKFLIDKDYGGTDLSELVWSVWVLGERGEAEVSYIGLGTVSDDDLVLTWNVIAAAAKDPGVTEIRLMGSNAGSTDTEYAWVSGKILLNVSPASPIDPGYDEDEIEEVRQLITDMGGEEAKLKAYTDTALETAKAYTDTAQTTDKAYTDAALETAKAYSDTLASAFSNPNLLDNWYFHNPINQLNTSHSGHTSGYLIDRWYVGHGTAWLNDSNIVLIAADDGQAEIVQVYDGLLPSGTYTVSIYSMFSILYTANYTYTQSSGDEVYIGDTGYRFSMSKNDSGNTVFELKYVGEAQSSGLALWAVKVEAGSHQTLAHQENDVWALNEIPNRGEQLCRCQRYYVNSSRTAYLANGSEAAFANIAFPVVMSDTPTVSITDQSGDCTVENVTAEGFVAKNTDTTADHYITGYTAYVSGLGN